MFHSFKEEYRGDKQREAAKLLRTYAECEADFRLRPFEGVVLRSHGWDGKASESVFLDGILRRAIEAAKEAK